MDVEQTRQHVADHLTAALQGVKVHPYRPAGIRKATNAWVQLKSVDTTECTFGEVRLQLEIVLPVANEQAAFERAFDQHALPLMRECLKLGRGVSVRPYTELVDAATLLCVVASLTTESEI